MAASTESSRLRVVGQELEQRKISNFELVVDQDGYHVRGYAPPAPREVAPPPKRKLIDLFKTKPAVVPADPNPEPELWERAFSVSDIDGLNDVYKTQRTKTGMPDDYAVSQVLRVVGAYVDERRWALTGISRQSQTIEIQHRDAAGHVQTSSQRYAELYDFAMHMFKARKAAG